MDVTISQVQESLFRHGYSGISLENRTVSELYAIHSSAPEGWKEGPMADDWAMLSYVQTNSPVGGGGMSEAVAADVEQVLDGLLDASLLKERAVWFDRVGMHQNPQWPALATLHCLAAPIIYVPPTRTSEYSRYQVPDQWTLSTFQIFTLLENMLRCCSHCGPKCPLEFDSRLLNIAATLRFWPQFEATVGSCLGRGTFFSFASMDRFQYTIGWLQVILQLVLEAWEFGKELLSKSVLLYGPALFTTCKRCLSYAQMLLSDGENPFDLQSLDDALSGLVMLVNCCTLTVGHADREGFALWSLSRPQKWGYAGVVGRTNATRVYSLRHRITISQKNSAAIAANLCSGHSSSASCFRSGDKWLAALLLSNLSDFLSQVLIRPRNFSHNIFRCTLRELASRDSGFGKLTIAEDNLEPESLRCVASPPCSGEDALCFFNEHSGALPPTSVIEFLRDRRFSYADTSRILRHNRESLRRRIVVDGGVALISFQVTQRFTATRPHCCGACRLTMSKSPSSEDGCKKLVLIGWHVSNQQDSDIRQFSDSSIESIATVELPGVFNFVTVDANTTDHVLSRGVFSIQQPRMCLECNAKFVLSNVEAATGNMEWLEIHLEKKLPLALTFNMICDAIADAHNL